MKNVIKLIQSGRMLDALSAIQHSFTGTSPASSSPDEQSETKSEENDNSEQPNVNPLQSFTDQLSNFKFELPMSLGQATGFTVNEQEIIPENAQFLKITFKYGQSKHDYRLYVPSSYQQNVEKKQNMPLIIMLHGCNQTAEDFAVDTRMNTLAEIHHCIVAYPSQPVSANQNRCWNWFRTSDQQREQGEPAWLAELTKTIVEQYAVEHSRVYVAGISSGAAMAIIMARTYPELYAAVGVHSGLAYQSASDVSSAMMAMHQGGKLSAQSSVTDAPFIPMIVFHGDKDSTVNIRNGDHIFEQAKQQLQTQASNLQTHQEKHLYENGRSSTQICLSDNLGTIQLEYWKIHGAGHHWIKGSSSQSSTNQDGLNASEEMMRFFLYSSANVS